MLDLILSGAAAHVDCLMIDWHVAWVSQDYPDMVGFISGGDDIAAFLRDSLKQLATMTAEKFHYPRRMEILETDDETFADYKDDVPYC